MHGTGHHETGNRSLGGLRDESCGCAVSWRALGAGQAFAVTITWIAVALSLWGAMSTEAVVAGSLSCLVSIPLYYVLERKLVKG